MTPKEAIERLERLQEPEPWEPHISQEAYEALEIAIEAIKEQIPQKPVMGYAFPEKLRTVMLFHGDKEKAEAKTECCPACGRTLGVSQFVKQQTGASFGDLFCKRCGQAIDWS